MGVMFRTVFPKLKPPIRRCVSTTAGFNGAAAVGSRANSEEGFRFSSGGYAVPVAALVGATGVIAGMSCRASDPVLCEDQEAFHYRNAMEYWQDSPRSQPEAFVPGTNKYGEELYGKKFKDYGYIFFLDFKYDKILNKK